MALVKLINMGPGTFTKIHNGVKYALSPDPSGTNTLIVEEGIAKHWLGDWGITDAIEAEAEKKRLTLLNGSQEPNYKIKVERLKEMAVNVVDNEEDEIPVINEAVEAPEEEFEALDEIVIKKAKPKSKSK